MSKSERSRPLGWRRMGGAMCTLALLLGCAKTAQAPAPVPSEENYRIVAGDVLDLIVWKEEGISGPVTVRPDGKISVALVGDVQASGLTPEELAGDLHARLLKFLDDPNVVVRVAWSGRHYYVVGNVRSPGMYELRPNQTLVQALAVAGGFTEFAKRGSVRIIRNRGAEATGEYDYDAITKGDTPDVRLEANDTIVVP